MADKKAIAKQFQEDLHADGGVLFCQFCEYCINFVCVDTIKEHLKQKIRVWNGI